MNVTPAKIEANRRNALKSTGPKTPEGKARSRANSLIHGLCASVVVAEDAALVQQRSSEYFDALKPQNYYQTWLVDQAAVFSLRIDRCERMERRLRDKISLRAELTWDDDRRLEAEALGRMIERAPAETVEALRRTPHGCRWLISRWSLLKAEAEANDGWDAEQTALAFDLLATPAQFRKGRKPGASPNSGGKPLDSAAVARRQIAELKRRIKVVVPLDGVERALTEADLTHDTDPELKRLRRYEASLHRQMRWCIAQLQAKSPGERTLPGLRPRWIEDPLPAPETLPKTEDEKAAEYHPASSPHPPFDLEPDEFPAPGLVADIPAILKARKEKRIAKAEMERDARRRKVERLRA